VGTPSGAQVGVGAFGAVHMVMVPRNPADTSSTAASKVLRGPLQALLAAGINSPDLDAYNLIAVGAYVGQGAEWAGWHHMRHVLQQGSCMLSNDAQQYWEQSLGSMHHCSGVCHGAATAPVTVPWHLTCPSTFLPPGPSKNATIGYDWAVMIMGRPRTWTGKGCRSGDAKTDGGE
jgi:hypothetical protein